MGRRGHVMSTLTKCCSCSGCVPEITPWVIRDAETSTATVSGNTVTLREEGEAAVAGPFGQRTLVVDCEFIFPMYLFPLIGGWPPQAVPDSVHNPEHTEIRVPLWCDESGDSAIAEVVLSMSPSEPNFVPDILSAEPGFGSFILPAPFVVPLMDNENPSTHIITPCMPFGYAMEGLVLFNPRRRWHTAFRSHTLTLALKVNGQTRQTVIVPTLGGGDSDSAATGIQSVHQQRFHLKTIRLQITAVKEDDSRMLDVAVCLMGIGDLRDYRVGNYEVKFDESFAYSEPDGEIIGPAMLWNPYFDGSPSPDVVASGVKFAPQWHLFDSEDYQETDNASAAVIVERLDESPEDENSYSTLTPARVTARARGYGTVAKNVALIPADRSRFCNSESDGYIDPNSASQFGGTGIKTGVTLPENPHLYPWWKTPCTHWVRGGRVTNSLQRQSPFSGLRVTFPSGLEIDSFDFGGPNAFNRTYGRQLAAIYAGLEGQIELTSNLNGDQLADNTFAYSGQGGSYGDYEAGAVLVTARINVQVGQGIGSWNYAVDPPCQFTENGIERHRWDVFVTLNISGEVTDPDSGRVRILLGTNFAHFDAGFLFGDEAIWNGAISNVSGYDTPGIILVEDMWPHNLFAAFGTQYMRNAPTSRLVFSPFDDDTALRLQLI